MRSFLPWLLLLVVLRGVLVLSLGDAFFYGEELEKAAAGKAMLDGLGIPHHQLAYHYYEGGGFVLSHMKAVAFWVMGESLLANKVVALLWCVGVLAAGWWACGRAFGRAAAHVFCALYCFAPAAVQKLSMISLGIHHEACVFVFLALGLTAAAMEVQRVRTVFWLGVCLGFGTYFSWVVGLVAVTCALALLGRWRLELDGRGVVAGFGGVLVGALPLLLMYGEVGGAVFDIHGTGLAADAARPTSEAVREFMRSIYVDGALGAVGAAIAWPAVVVLAWIMGWRWSGVSAWTRSFRCFSGFCGIFLIAYLSSAFVQGEVYHFFLMLRLVPLWVVGVACVAAVIGRAWEEGGRESKRWIMGAVLLFFGVVGTVESVSEGRPAELMANAQALQAERGYVYPSYFTKLIPHLEGGVDERLAVLLRFDEDGQGLLRESIAAELFRRHGESLEADYEDAQRAVEALEPGRWDEYLRGLGPLLVDWYGGELVGCLDQTQQAAERGALLAEALGRTGRGVRPRGAAKDLAGVEAVLLEDLALVEGRPGSEAFARGVGWRLHSVLHRIVYQPWRAAAFIARVPEGQRGAVRGGYEEAVRVGRLHS